MEHQISMFDNEPLTRLQECLLHGSGFENGKIRIYAAALQQTKKEFAEFLKQEYGIGGFSTADGFVDYDSKGICICRWRENSSARSSWVDVAGEIKYLIATDIYLSEKDKEKIKNIQNKYKDLPKPEPRFMYG